MWVFDYIPWWVWPILLGGGGVALFALVPGFAALALGIWNALPNWARWLLGGALVALLAFLRGRNLGARDVRDRQAQLDRQAVDKAHEVTKRNQDRTDDEIDKHLKDTGGFWDDEPPSDGRPTRKRG